MPPQHEGPRASAAGAATQHHPATKTSVLSGFGHRSARSHHDQLPPDDPPADHASDDERRTHQPYDLWERIRQGLALPRPPERKRIAAQLSWVSFKQRYFDGIAERALPYLHHIVEEVERHDMPSEIALLPIIESAYQPEASSPVQAAGIWQLIPSTGKRFGLKRNEWYDGRRDVLASTTAALDYLQALHEKFDGDWLHAIAAYNCGEKVVEQAVERNRAAGRSADFWSLDLPQETEKFVPRLLAVASLVADPSLYRVSLRPIPNQPYVTEVQVGGQIGLARAAKLADISADELRSLNPGYTRAVTDPRGPNKLALPVSKAARFERRLAELPPEQKGVLRREMPASGYVRYTIRAGDSLRTISRRFGVTVSQICQWNALPDTNPRLEAGWILHIYSEASPA